MSTDTHDYPDRLRRLSPEHYQGHAYVHWSMTLEGRSTGWLDALHHAQVREILCHALARYRLLCPAYCLMPDHGHFLWVGWDIGSDQGRAAKLFREGWNDLLRRGNRSLQRQPYEHVLREDERARGAFGAVGEYVFANPIRAGLGIDWKQYPFSGCLLPGYPRIDPREENFWGRFWRIFERLAESSSQRNA